MVSGELEQERIEGRVVGEDLKEGMNVRRKSRWRKVEGMEESARKDSLRRLKGRTECDVGVCLDES